MTRRPLRCLSLITASVGALAPAWSQTCGLELLRPGAPVLGDWFGHSVALAGDLAFVGASGRDSSEQNTGGVYVLRQTPGGLVQEDYLAPTPLGFGERFGERVASDGQTLVVGLASPTSAGRARLYVYELSAGVFVETAQLSVAGDANGSFGFSFAVDGDVIVAGAPYDDDLGLSTGNAVVFERGAGGWSAVQELMPSDASSHLRVGWAVDVDGERIAVGAPWDDDLGVASGSVTIWRRDPSGWVEEDQVVPFGGASGFWEFGRSLDLSGDALLVGAPLADGPGPCGGGACDYGQAYVFRRNGARWQAEANLLPPVQQFGEEFGYVLALDGERAAIATGHFMSDDREREVWTFERSAGTWARSGFLRPHDGAFDDGFGAALALEGRELLIGAARANLEAIDMGRLHVVELCPTGVVAEYGHCPSGPCANPDFGAGCVNSAGYGALLTAFGSRSVADDRLELWTSQLPPGRSGLYFFGPNALDAPFGDGRRVVGGTTGRFFPVLNSGALRRFRLGPGIVAHSAAHFPLSQRITAGSTWNFQAWYRDPAGPCGSGFNLSNGVRVTFTP